MPIHGECAHDICHLYITDIRRYMKVVKFCPKTHIFLSKHAFSRCKMDFCHGLSNNKTIILLNLVEYHLILANWTYGLVS